MLKVLYGALLLVCVANAASIEDLKIVDKATIEETVVEVTTETPKEKKISESTEVPDVDVAEPRVDVAVDEDVVVDEVEGVGEVIDVAEPRKDVDIEENEEIVQDEAQDRFVDLSVDVSYGLPQLGYVYNGIHLRGPRKGKGGNFVSHGVPQGASGRQTFQTNFDFDSDFQDIRDQFTSQDPNNIQLVIEESNRNPGVNTFGLKTPIEPIAVEEFVVEPTLASVSNAGQFNYPPYVSPASEAAPPAQNSVVHAGPTKPPLHIKIQHDLKGLMGSMRTMLMGTQKRGSTSPLKGLPPLINSFPKASTSPFKLKMPSVSIPQAPGKPPLMEKIRQDFFSWLPTTNEVPSASYGAPEPSYGAPEPAYEAPSPSYETPAPAYHAPAPAYVAPSYEEPELYQPPAYVAPAPAYVEPTYEEPELYQPPTYPKQGSVAREPMLSKFVKDFDKVNKWLARETLKMVNDGETLKFPFELPELPQIPTLQNVQKKLLNRRAEDVMRYINDPDLSKQQNEQ